MQTRQAFRIFQNVTDARGSIPLRVIVNGIAFPIKQRIVIGKNNVAYIVADTTPERGDIVDFPWQRSKRKHLTKG